MLSIHGGVNDVIAIARVAADVPSSLHRRAKLVAKERRSTISELIRDSLTKEIEFFEAKSKEEQAARERAREPKRKISTASHIAPLDQRPSVDLAIEEPVDRLVPIFEDHARRIMEVFDRPVDLAARQREAFIAIRRLAPITYADDKKIVARLESLIAARASLDELPAPSVVLPTAEPMPIANPETFSMLLAPFAKILQQQTKDDPLIGRSINPSRVRSRGVVDEGDKET